MRRSSKVAAKEQPFMRIQPTSNNQPQIERKPPPAAPPAKPVAEPAATVNISAAAQQAAKGDADGDGDGK